MDPQLVAHCLRPVEFGSRFALVRSTSEDKPNDLCSHLSRGRRDLGTRKRWDQVRQATEVEV